jgi:hypothetical protein
MFSTTEGQVCGWVGGVEWCLEFCCIIYKHIFPQDTSKVLPSKRTSIFNYLLPGISEFPSTSMGSKEISDASLRRVAITKVRTWSNAGYLDEDETEVVTTEILAGNDSLAAAVVDSDISSVQYLAQEAFESEVRQSQLVGGDERRFV